MNATQAVDDLYKGYRGRARAKLEALGAPVWSDVRLQAEQGEFEGIILPRSETDDDEHVVLKLATGYNIGLHVDRIRAVQCRGRRVVSYKIPEKDFPRDPSKQNVVLLGTGGTIASRLDYRTGAVIPAFSPGELYGAVPELADIANLTTKKLYAVFSENMGPEQWLGLAREVAAQIEAGADGIVIGHGTDTMHHTAALLTFMLQRPPVPIVLVGSQRSSDRPSSDAALNLIHATYAAAQGDIAEVQICMFGPTSDQYSLLHPGARVRKMHSSYRSTFRTVGDTPLAMCDHGRFHYIRRDYAPRRADRRVTLNAAFEPKVTLLSYYPGMQSDIVEGLIDRGYRGIVIAGTGLGHVNKPLYPVLARAVAAGVTVVMTVQTLWGYVQMYVYDTGRDLLDMGIIPLDNMLPEVAYMKLGWVLGQTQDRDQIRRLMQTPVCRDITEREPHNGFLIAQGGVPETEAMIRQHRK